MTDRNQLDDFFTSKRQNEGGRAISNTSKKWSKKIKNLLPSKKQFIILPTVLSRKEKIIFIGLLVILIFSVFYIPVTLYLRSTKSAPDFGGVYKEGIVGEPRYINPLLAQANDADRDLSSIVFSGLMKYAPNGNLVPDLAKSYEISADGLTYTFALRENIKWHDDFPVSTDDVAFTILTAQNRDYNSPQIINWQGVEIKKIDSKTIQFILKNKYAQFLTNTTLGILPEHIWKDVKPINFALSDLNLKPVGSGPYMFKKLKKDSLGRINNYELRAYKEYYEGRPYIDEVRFSFFSSEDEMIYSYNRNEIQGMSFVSPKKLDSVKFKQRLNIKSVSIPRYFAVFLNQNQSKVLSDKNIRLALNYATNRKELVEKILGEKGTEVYSPILPDILHAGESLQKYKFDPDFAKTVLENSGWKPASPEDKFRKNKNNEELAVEITTSNWPELMQAAELLKKQWEELGIKVNLNILTISELQQKIKDRAYEALLFGEVLNINLDPFSFWHSSQKKDPGLNLALYDNKTVDKILEEARQTIDTLQRDKKYDDFQKVLIEDAPVVFLYSPDYIYSPAKKVKGNEINIISIPSDRFDNINKWYVETKRIKK